MWFGFLTTSSCFNAGHIHPGTLNCMQKTKTANIRHTITVFDAFDGLKFATCGVQSLFH